MKKGLFTKIVSLFLILTIAVPSVVFASTDEKPREIWATFGERSVFKNLKAWYGPDAEDPVVSTDPLGWNLSWKKVQTIYVDVSDSLMYDLKGEALEIEVDYYDEGEGLFTLTYDGYEKVRQDAEYVDLTDTKKWKTHTFFIQDAKFKNGLSNADFRISLGGAFLNGGNSTYSVRDDVVVGAVRVKKADVISPIQMKMTTDATGNIFFENQKIKINVDYTNKLKDEYKLNAHIEAVDTENRLLWEDNHKLNIGSEETISKTYEFDMDRFGMNWLRVTLTDDEGKVFCIKDAEFFYVTTNYGERLNYDVGVTTHQDQYYKYGEHEKVLPLVVNAGYGRERYELGWTRMYSGYSGYGLSPYHKKLLEDYKKAGLKRTIILSVESPQFPLQNGLEYSKGAPTPQFEKDYREYLRAIVRETKDYADSYIVGNEQDHSSYKPEQKLPSSYARWCQIAYEVVKEEYPEAKVLGYGLAMADKSWFEETIRLGTHNYFDQPAVHTYSVFRTYEGQDFLGRIQSWWDSVKEKYGVELPSAWITETGYFHLRHGTLSPFEISHQFPKLYIYSAASELVDTVVDYTMISLSPESYGHIRGADVKGSYDYDLPYAPYREYLTIACWNKNFGGDSDFVESIDGINTRLYKFKRRSDGKDFAALWTLGGIENVTLDLGTNEISYMDILGNEEKMYSDDGRYTFNLSEDIKYIIGNFPKFKVCDTPKYDFGVEQLGVIEGTSKEISVTVDGAKKEGYTISANDYMRAKTTYIGKENDALCLGVTLGSLADGYTAKYLAGETGRSQFHTFGKDHIRDVVSVDIMKDGKLYSRCEIPLTELQPATIECDVLPKSVEEINNWQVIYTVKNETDAELGGSFTVIEPAEIASSASPVVLRLAPGEETVLTYAVPASLTGQEVIVKSQLTLDSGAVIEHMDKKETFCAVYTDKAPTIDGTLDADEWVLDSKGKAYEDTYVKLTSENYTGADDLSATVNMMWDKENLYLALSVKDDVHKQAYTDGATWRADGLQIGFTAGENPSSFTHLMSALSDEGYLTKHVYASEDGSNEIGRASDEDFDLAIVHKDGLTTYEMRISWKLIMPLTNAVQVGDGGQVSGVIVKDDTRREAKSGETIRFSVLVNDDDGNGRGGYVEYGTGISGGTHKNFKDIILFGGNE